MTWSKTRRGLLWVPLLTLSGLLFPLLGISLAGQSVAASVIGQVTDESGAILPGVTVTATSPALQVPAVMDVTSERGEYRLTPLPIGTYKVVYELVGFGTLQREDLRLTAGFVAKVDVVLKVGSLAESITVSGQSPVVDFTSAAVVTQFTRESLELLPTARSGLYSLGALVPGVRAGGNLDVGGNQLVASAQVRVYGQQGDTWVVVEGVAAQSQKRETQGGGYYDYSAMEEVRAEVLASDVEAPRRGLKMTVVMKSGGNDFHGQGFWSYTNERFQGNNLTDFLRAQGFTRGPSLVKRYDVSGELGGRIIRDKLWFFGNARTASDQDIGLDSVKPDGTPAVTPDRANFYGGKVSFQPTLKHRFIGFHNWWQKLNAGGNNRLTAWESRSDQDFTGTTSKIEWQVVQTNTLLILMQYGFWQWGGFSNIDMSDGSKPARLDIRTQMRTGAAESAGALRNEGRHHPRAMLTWHKPDLFVGSHDFKVGADYMKAWIHPEHNDRGKSENYALRFDNGVPFQVLTFNYPAYSQNFVHHTAIYGSDSWAMTRRLTLNLGARFTRDNGFIPEACREPADFAAAQCFPKVQFPIYHALAPRLTAAYDLFGNATTVVKAGWTVYNRMRDADMIRLADSRAATSTTWLWRDLNTNGDYDPGEVNLNPNGPDFVSIAGTSNMVVNPDEQQEKSHEFMVSMERQLTPNIGARVSGVYQRNTDQVRLLTIARPPSVYNIPITQPDPGPDGVVRTADDPGTMLTYYDFPASLRAAQFSQTTYTNDPRATQTFRAIEFGVTRRLTGRWQVQGGFSATKKNIPYVFNAGGGASYPLLTFDPNAEINTSDRTWDWGGKLSGIYRFPYGIMSSAHYQVESGNAFARTVLLRGGVAIPSYVMRVEPIGTRRLPTNHLLDFRFEKALALGGNRQVALRLNLYNVLNSSTVLSVTDRSGPQFLQPTGGLNSIMPPRLLAFGATYSF